jgi:CheY-like chemotaxis protein
VTLLYPNTPSDVPSTVLPNDAIANALIVTNSEVSSAMISSSLAQVAVAAETCAEAASCLKTISRKRFEVVFIDFAVGTALSAIDDVRQSVSSRTSIVVAIVSNEAQLKQAFGHGAHFVLQQPLSRSSVDGVIRAGYGLIVRERRRYYRCPINIPVVAYRKIEGAWQGRLINVSEGGACIVAPVELAAGELVEINFSLSSSAEVSAHCKVQWRTQDARAGLNFVELHGESREELQEWLAVQLDVLFASKHQKL